MIHSYVAPRYYPHIGPILVRWEDYEYGSLRLVIGSHAYSKTRATFLSQVVCRDVVGALVLLMNLQLESHANRVNATTDSSMFRIKSSTTNQGIHTNSFLRVNKAFCQFALDFISMLLVYNAWSSHVSQTVPAPHARQVPQEVYDAILTNRTILVHYILANQVSQAGTFFIITTLWLSYVKHASLTNSSYLFHQVVQSFLGVTSGKCQNWRPCGALWWSIRWNLIGESSPPSKITTLWET